VTTVLFGKHIDKAPWDAPEGVNTLPVLLGEERARRATATLMIAFYIAVLALVLVGVLAVWTLVVFAAAGTLARTLRTYRAEKPASPPPRYPLWPLWFGPWAFVHARRAGALLVIGLAAGAAFPTFIQF
jgi:1,4-dihydroxy-2-naphthoate octaprenyltransferase